MTYNEFIQNIIDERGQWTVPDGGIWQNHHIIPLCMGGEPKKYDHYTKHSNLIWLTPEEHFTAHKMLAKENPDISNLCFAYWCMVIMKQPNGESYEVTPEEYGEAVRSLANMYANYERSDEFKRKVSEGMKRQRAEVGFSEEHLIHISESLKLRKSNMHAMGLNMYGTPLRKDGECGTNQQFATRSIQVGCYYNGNEYSFNSMREAGIWWFNTCKPFGDKYVECTLQRKIRNMCNGKTVTWGTGKKGLGKKNRKILNDEIVWFWKESDVDE